MDFALRGALELSDPVGPGRSRGASERGATRREERGRERQVAPAVGARARRVSRAGGYASSVSFADRNSRVTLRVTVLPFYPVPYRPAGSRDNTVTSADRSGKYEAGSLRTGRIPLSRWRHGFEPRWDYQETLRSESLSSLSDDSPLPFVPHLSRGRPRRVGNLRGAVRVAWVGRLRAPSNCSRVRGQLRPTQHRRPPSGPLRPACRQRS
jgi:hypothetical protein